MEVRTSTNPISALEIFTIGHSNLRPEKLEELLTRYEITIVVDVRSSPYSQFNPQFNRESLKFSLESHGFEYRYAGDFLGGRPKDPDCYKDGKLPDGKADYLHLVNYPAVMEKDFFKKGIQNLLKLAGESRVVVMCSEEDPAICHRHHLVGKYLVGQGVNVFHIRGTGDLLKDQYLPNLSEEPPVEQLKLF